jgi:hypothetical protein
MVTSVNDDTARKGLVTHLAVAQKLVERGYEVLQPLGDYRRYDLVGFIPAASADQNEALGHVI